MNTKPESLSPRQWVRLVAVYLLIPLILFLCAGDWGWWQAWVFTLLFLAVGIGGRLWAERRHPGLLAERATSESAEGVKPWDKVLAPLMAVSTSFPLLIVAGLDHRFEWSPRFPLWLNLLGLGLIALGYAFGTWALAENRFFSGTVRIQTDRGHTGVRQRPVPRGAPPRLRGKHRAAAGVGAGVEFVVDNPAGDCGAGDCGGTHNTGRPDAARRAGGVQRVCAAGALPLVSGHLLSCGWKAQWIER